MPAFVTRPDVQGSRLPRWVVAWFAVLLAVTVGVRVLDPTGWLGSDDAAYHSAAQHVLTGVKIERVHHHYARLAVILPIAAGVAVFGDNPAAVALPSVIASTLCVILVALLGRVLWGWWVGLTAATVFSFVPYFRVLSTTAFPDVHVCLWTTAAMLLAACANRANSTKAARWTWIACGFACGLAVSAKVFAVTVLVGVLWLAWAQKGVASPLGPRNVAPPLVGGAGHRRWPALACLAFGIVAFQLFDGLFYHWAAGDFFFSLRATLHAQDNVASMAADKTTETVGFFAFVWDRLAMPARASTSGWGILGIVFWPMLALAALLDRRSRPLVAWAVATYILVAFVPLSFKDGARPYPIFHGRHVLPACIPFAFCVAWAVHQAIEGACKRHWEARSWPVVVAVVVALALVTRRELNGFRDRATSRVGVAITELIRTTILDTNRPIFMTPSTYWRFRLLFPPELRDRLRVATDNEAPSWWRRTCPDIVSRLQTLPAPGDAYLIATPRQLQCEPEPWDYGVSLPGDALGSWREIKPQTTLLRLADRRIAVADGKTQALETVLFLLGNGNSTDAATLLAVEASPSDHRSELAQP